MIRLVSRKPDVHLGMEIITLQDSLGRKHIAQIPLSKEHDAAAIIKKECEAMAEREAEMREVLLARGHEVPSVDDQADGYKGCCPE